MRKTSIEEKEILGDIYAEPGSPPWSLAIKNRLQDLLREHVVNHDLLERYQSTFVEHKGWLALKDATGRTFASYTAFC
jgi:hypothetical protein